jgi:hypothetical protein
VPNDTFANFVYAFGAARKLLKGAHDAGSLIEGMALYASLLDGFLRIGLVLKRQLNNRNNSIDDSLISQTKGGKFYTERQIYRMALQEKVIDGTVYDSLSRLYDRRNEIIHKFFLTSITYDSLAEDLMQYEGLFEQLYDIVFAIEAEQIEKGVGMTTTGKSGNREEIFKEINKKLSPTANPPSSSTE